MTPEDPERDWTAPGAYEVDAGIYRIPLPLPQDGLRAVNVYAVQDGDGVVLVDSGWAIAEARALLEQALKAIGSGPSEITRILVTHAHRDHYTLGVALRRDFGVPVEVGRGEAETLALAANADVEPWTGLVGQLGRGGGGALVREMLSTVPSEHVAQDWAPPSAWLDPPCDITLTDRVWQVVPTPGHTRGHVVFVDASRDVMFAGDHVLPQITPSIGFEQSPAESPLTSYLGSLRRVRELPDRRLLAAHGPVTGRVHARVDELLAHHDLRLRQVADAVQETGAGTALVVAQQLRWTRRLRRFDELDLFSRCLAVTETLAHLEVLAATKELRRTVMEDVEYYRPT
ncbi:MAG: hypothetical protein ABS81_16415 [Pseudonocardia sp. SCN 72-86]|nr:MAG: hypothetical protein ABS81_16415 [Pseudonocardia sp. SCN 72-86]